ncbi:MAG: inorganic phosphate transporter [Deltaproteobacteria bacterium]|nr:inorganic phosphate transporter [Deltaproteobacteria bacterium]
MTVLLFSVLVLVLAAEFVNGWHDASNAIATVVSTRVLSPRVAVLMATVFNAIGAFSGTAVAATIGKGIVATQSVNLTTVAAAMGAIVVWDVFTWYYGLPTSTSHALVAGLSGAALAAAGPSALLWDGWQKVLTGLLFSTFLGFFAGFVLIWAILWVCRAWSPGRVRNVFGRLQVFSAVFMAFSHGSNDGQKFIGVFTLALVLGGVIPEFQPSFGVVLLCSITMGIGTSVGGWRIIRTMGMKVAKLEPYHGFAAETAAGACIELASRLGIPLSTTHTINTAIMGVGSSRRLSAVRWGVVGDVVTAWILTFPVCGAIGWIMATLLGTIV